MRRTMTSIDCTQRDRGASRGDGRRVLAGARRAAAAALYALGVAAMCSACTPSTDSSAPARAHDDAAPPERQIDTADWLTYSDAALGVAFRYPADLGTTYIHPVDWPPMPRLLSEPFQCTEAGSETARAGKTERLQVGARTYCVTRESEGAAGSIYTSYAYAFEKDGRVAILTFSVRAVQCANYDEPHQTECGRERQSFDPDTMTDTIARTLELR